MNDAIAIWYDGCLSVYGISSECGLHLCGIPFRAANNLAEIKGQTYAGEREMPFSEGRLIIADQPLHMNDGKINCIGVGSNQESVALEFSINVEDHRGRTRKLTGGIRCRIVDKVEPAFSEIEG